MSKDKIKHHKKEPARGRQGKAEHHKKDKPKKEHDKVTAAQRVKKPKGIKQTQKQKQTVNIKINNGGGGGGGDDEKKKKLPFPIPMPNIVFNPSLSFQPNAYPITKPETNPPYFEMPIMPNFNMPEQTPPIIINNKKEKPKANTPISVNISDNAITLPPETYQPIPQDDVSKPKELLPIPELFIGNETIKTKHDLHKEQMKQIKPDNPPIITPKKPKIQDTEGLGANIPISKIAGIAGTIIGGGLTGGAVAGTEALISGGLSGVTSEALQGAFIGGGIGASVNEAVGGGPIGHYISSVAGGLVSRASQPNTTRQNRTSENTSRINTINPDSSEPPPLVPFRGGGNRLGGQRVQGDDVVSRRIAAALSRNQRTIQQDTNDIRSQISQNAPQTAAEDLPRILIKTDEELGELIREVNQEQSATALIGDRVKSKVDRKSVKSKVDETQMKAPEVETQPKTPLANYIERLQQKHARSPATPEIVDENIVYQSRRARRNIATLNRNGDGTGQLVLQQVGVGSTPLKRTPFKGQGRRASGRMSIGTIRGQQQLDLDNLVNQTIKDVKHELDKSQEAIMSGATKLQAVARRAIKNPDIQARETVNEMINQLEYQTAAQQRAQQILQTVQPSTDLSTSSILSRTAPRIQRPRSEPIRSAAERANDAIGKITNKVEKNIKTLENQLLNAQSRAIETGLIKKAQKTAQQLQTTQESINQALQEGRQIRSRNTARNTAAGTIQSALRNRQARKQMTQQKQQFNPEEYKLLLEKNKDKFTRVASHLRRGRIYTDQAQRMRKTDKHLTSITALEDKPQTRRGRPPGSYKQDQEQPGSISSIASTILSGMGAAFTPKKK